MLIQGETALDEIQERVGALEREIFGDTAGRPRYRTGLRISDWFLPTALARALVLRARKMEELGPLLGLGRLRVAKALTTKPRHAWRLHADALAINKNYRFFFLPKRLTVKAHFLTPGRPDPIAREIHFRRVATSTPAIRLPEMRYHGTSIGASYIVEQIVPRASRVNPSQGGGDLADALFDFYASNAMRTRPLGEVATLDCWREAAAEALLAIGFAPSRVIAVEDGLTRLFEEAADRPVLWGLCHGDLSLGNMLRAGKSVYLLDWEEAHHGLIYGDLAKLSANVPGFEHRFDRRARDFCGIGGSLSVQKRLAEVALLHKLWRERESGPKRPSKQRRLKTAAERVVAGCTRCIG